MNGYDHWKATNPDDEWLGPEPDQDDEEPEKEELPASLPRARSRNQRQGQVNERT
jgi:hypothetical protein